MSSQGKSIAGQRVSPIVVFLISIAAAVIVLAGMKAAAGVVASLMLAGMLTIALAPLQVWLIKKRWPSWLALLATMLVGVLILASLILVLVASLAQLADALPTYSDEIDGLTSDVTKLLVQYDVDVDTIMNELSINTSRIVEMGASLVTSLLGALTDTGLVIVIIAFMLFEALELPKKIEIVKPRMGEERLMRWQRSLSHTRQYLVLTAGMGAATGAINAIFLLFLGVDFAILWGIVAFLLSFIPNVGFILALIPPTVLALLEFGWQRALIVVIGYIVINGFFDNVLKPKFMGEGIDLSALLVFVSLIFWGFILGPLGAILAIPLTVLVKELIIESDKDISWVGVLMGTAAGAEEEVAQLDAVHAGGSDDE
jgi:predicted PurR-regulated permease PerM